MAFDATFRHAIPGQSLIHKMGDLPHEKPPQFVDASLALEHIWKMLHQKQALKQIWACQEQGVTVWAITKALLYRLTLNGVIQMNLAIMIYQTVGRMIATLGAAKGINVKLNPKFRDKTSDGLMTADLNKRMGRPTNTPLPPSAMKSTMMPKPEEITARAKAAGLPTQAPIDQDNDKAAGLLNNIQSTKGQ